MSQKGLSRRSFIWMLGAAVIPKPPVNLWTAIELSKWAITPAIKKVYQNTITAVMHARLNLEWEKRTFFLKNLNKALSEKWFPIFWDVDLDNLELWTKRREILEEWFYESVKQHFIDKGLIEKLEELKIQWSIYSSIRASVDEEQIQRIVRIFWKTGELPDEEFTAVPELHVIWEKWELIIKLLTEKIRIIAPNRWISIDVKWTINENQDFLNQDFDKIFKVVEENWLSEYNKVMQKIKEMTSETSNQIYNHLLRNSTAITPIDIVSWKVSNILEDELNWTSIEWELDFILNKYTFSHITWDNNVDLSGLIEDHSYYKGTNIKK